MSEAARELFYFCKGELGERGGREGKGRGETLQDHQSSASYSLCMFSPLSLLEFIKSWRLTGRGKSYNQIRSLFLLTKFLLI